MDERREPGAPKFKIDQNCQIAFSVNAVQLCCRGEDALGPGPEFARVHYLERLLRGLLLVIS